MVNPETLNNREERYDSVDEVAEVSSIDDVVENDKGIEQALSEMHLAGSLTPDFMEEHAETLLSNGLSEEKFEYYEKLSRKAGKIGLEDRRRRADEEPELEGYEPEPEEKAV